MSTTTSERSDRKRLVQATVLSWISMLAFDVFLHGGLLAHWYVEGSTFLLPAREAFVRIPLGYAAFLVLAGLLVWTLSRLGVDDGTRGVRIGLGLGAAVWGSSVLGLYSITTAPAGLLAGWFLGQTLEMGIAGGFAAATLGGARTRSLAWKLGLLILICVILTITLQSTGLAPSIRAG